MYFAEKRPKNFAYNTIDKVVVLRYNMTTKTWRCYVINGISIRPSKDLRTNYAKISELAKKNPVAITVNGREDTVVLSHEDFVEQQRLIADMQARLELYAHLARSQDDIKLGRVQPVDEAFDELIEEIGRAEL